MIAFCTGLAAVMTLALPQAAPGAAMAKDWTRLVIATEGAFPPYNMTMPDGKPAGCAAVR